jgi:hypothetical protein
MLFPLLLGKDIVNGGISISLLLVMGRNKLCEHEHCCIVTTELGMVKSFYCQCVGVGSSFRKRLTMVVCIKRHERKDGFDAIVCGKFERWC